MNTVSIILICAVAVAVATAVYAVIRGKTGSCSMCNGDCKSCKKKH